MRESTAQSGTRRWLSGFGRSVLGCWVLAVFLGAWSLATPLNSPSAARPSMPTNVLAWDALLQEVEAKWGDTNVTLVFHATNTSSAEVVIKMGRPLYLTACGICHEVPERASMVPDLHAIRRVPTAGYWRQWISEGRSGTLMPGFAQSEGGPLSVEQIDSLVDYLLREYPQEKPGLISDAELNRNPMTETNSKPAK